jgi:hypothetical protein
VQIYHLAKIITRTMRILTRLGALIEEPERTYLAETDTDGAPRSLQAASCTYRIALGPRAGQKVLSLQSLPSVAKASAPELRVNAHGFSLHAAVRWRADQRAELEQLCRYITRPAIANERLKRNRAGQVVLQLKSPYKDGTTHIEDPPVIVKIHKTFRAPPDRFPAEPPGTTVGFSSSRKGIDNSSGPAIWLRP